MSSKWDNDFTTINFEEDPVLQCDSLDRRVNQLFHKLDQSIPDTLPAVTTEEFSSDEDRLVIDESKRNAESPTQFLSSPSTVYDTPNTPASSRPSAPPTPRSIPASTTSTAKLLEDIDRSSSSSVTTAVTIEPAQSSVSTAAKMTSKAVPERLTRWESPDDKIHRYDIKKQAANVKYKEYTKKFIALKTASRKIDTRQPLPDAATVNTLQVIKLDTENRSLTVV